MQLNGLLEKMFFVRVTQVEVLEFTDFFNSQMEHQGLQLGQAIFRYMDDLDNKSSALLTHVSMLIAAVSIMLSVDDNPLTRGFLLAEAAAYIFIATGLLRCLSILNPKNLPLQQYQANILRETIARVQVYRRARTLTIVVTLAFFVSIFLKLLFD